MHISSPIVRRHVRIEIIPLIDIMFFLLASFMMVSLNMTKIENIQVPVPAASQVQREFPPDMVHVAVDKGGTVWVGKEPITLTGLFTVLTNRFHANPQLAVYIAGDGDTHHGDMVGVLEFVRKAGVQRVSFVASPEPTGGKP